jgi:regulator of protease activity HflC (stomatin/prohibitin superfamily)
MAQLTVFETIVKYACGIATVPFTLFGVSIYNVKQNTKNVVMRFGKLDRVMKPGLRWAPLYCEIHPVFIGANILQFENLRAADFKGDSIIVKANVQYHIDNPASFVIVANSKTNILEFETNKAIRTVCGNIPYISEDNKNYDLPRHSKIAEKQALEMVEESVEQYGFVVDKINIVEVNYTPQITPHTFMKQQ